MTRGRVTLLIVLTHVLPGVAAAEASDAASSPFPVLSPGFSKVARVGGDSGDLQSVFDLYIVTASKRAEPIFDSVLGATVLTREEIERSGALSIAEALRLIPGMIVREHTPGAFVLQLRGFDIVPPTGGITQSQGRSTLVMIDNRIVFSDVFADTFWDTIPVSIDDVESIEVVRGPVSALYGPNATSGAINIITRKSAGAGLHATANARAGTVPGATTGFLNTKQGELSVAYETGALSVRLSANGQDRKRHETEYLGLGADRARFENPDDIRYYDGQPFTDFGDLDIMYPHPDRSIRSGAANLFLTYEISDTFKVDASTGVQTSQEHAALFDTSAAQLNFKDSRTAYAHLVAKTGDLRTAIAYSANESDLHMGDFTKTNSKILEGETEYEAILSGLRLRPGLQVRSSHSQATSFVDPAGWLFYAAMLRAEYDLFGVKLVAAGRAESQDANHRWNFPFQLGALYKLTPRHVLRIHYGRAFQSPSILDSFMKFDYNIAGFPVRILGDPQAPSRRSDSVEIGYRGKVTDSVSIDAEVFSMWLTDISTAMPSPSGFNDGAFEFVQMRTAANGSLLGATASIGYEDKPLSLRAFVTVQRTKFYDYSTNYFERPTERTSGDLKTVPTAFGGFVANYDYESKLNVNINGYLYSQEEFPSTYHESPDIIPPKAIVTATVGYAVMPELTVQASCHNALGQPRREFPRTDRIMSTILVGVSAQL